MGGSKIAPPKIGPLRGNLPMGPKWGCKLHPHQVGPCGVGCPFVRFRVCEGEWVTGKVGDGEWVEWLPEGGDGEWVEWLP